MPINTFPGLFHYGFQLICKLPVAGTPLRFDDLVGEAIKITLRTVGDGTNHAF
jgi:hypothetical protein